MQEIDKGFYRAVYDDVFGWQGRSQDLPAGKDYLSAVDITFMVNNAATTNQGVADFLQRCFASEADAKSYEQEIAELSTYDTYTVRALHMAAKQKRAEQMRWQSANLVPVEQDFMDRVNKGRALVQLLQLT